MTRARPRAAFRPAVLATLAGALALGALAPAAEAADADEVGHRRVVDVEFHPVVSIPDAIGVCLEAFPLRHGLSVRGCASIQVFEAAALSLDVTYRFPLHTGPKLTLGLGPGIGSHAIFDSPRGPLIDVSADGFASLEAVWWGDRTGFSLQLGAGAMYMVWDQPSGITERWVPIVDLTIGLAVRTKGMTTGVAPPAPSSYFGR